jgi:hypothetical protein
MDKKVQKSFVFSSTLPDSENLDTLIVHPVAGDGMFSGNHLLFAC